MLGITRLGQGSTKSCGVEATCNTMRAYSCHELGLGLEKLSITKRGLLDGDGTRVERAEKTV